MLTNLRRKFLKPKKTGGAAAVNGRRAAGIKSRTEVEADVQRAKVHREVSAGGCTAQEGGGGEGREEPGDERSSPRGCTGNPRLRAEQGLAAGGGGLLRAASRVSQAIRPREYEGSSRSTEGFQWEEPDGLRRTLSRPASQTFGGAWRRPVNFEARAASFTDFYGDSVPETAAMDRGYAPPVYAEEGVRAINRKREDLRRWALGDDPDRQPDGAEESEGTRDIADVRNARSRWVGVSTMAVAEGVETPGPIARGRGGNQAALEFPEELETKDASRSRTHRSRAPMAGATGSMQVREAPESGSRHGRVPEDAYESRNTPGRFGRANMGGSARPGEQTKVHNPHDYAVSGLYSRGSRTGLGGGAFSGGGIRGLHVPQGREGDYGTRTGLASGGGGGALSAAGASSATAGLHVPQGREGDYGTRTGLASGGGGGALSAAGASSATAGLHVPQGREGDYGTGARASSGAGALGGGVTAWGLASRGRDRALASGRGAVGAGRGPRGGLLSGYIANNAFLGARMSKNGAIPARLSEMLGGSGRSVRSGGESRYDTSGRVVPQVTLPDPSGGSGMASRMTQESFFNWDRVAAEADV